MNRKLITTVLNKILKHSSQQSTLDSLKTVLASKNPYTDASVQFCIKSLYTIYSDLSSFAHSIPKSTTGKATYKVVSTLKPLLDEVPEVEGEDDIQIGDDDIKNNRQAITALANSISKAPEYLKPTLPEDKFSNLFADMFMSASMRAWRMYLILNAETRYNIPFDKKIARAKRDLSADVTNTKDLYKHELNPKLPVSLADKEALKIFISSNTPFANQAKEQYGLYNITEAADKITHDVSDPEGAKLIRKAAYQKYKTTSSPEAKKPVISAEPSDYVIYTTVHTISTLLDLGDITSTAVVEDIFKQAGNSIGKEDFESSEDIIGTAFEIMPDDMYEDDYQEQEHTTMLTDEEIHNEYVVVVCKKVLDDMPSDIINSFNFKVIDPSGSGKILTVNLYRDLIKSEFNENLYSKSGATLIQQLYRNWIPSELQSTSSSATTTKFIKSPKELEALKASLPTEPKSIEALKDLATNNLAVATVNNGVKMILNPYTAGGRIMDRVGERLRPYFAPGKASSAMSGPALAANARNAFGITFGSVSKSASVKKGAALSSGQVDLEQAFEIFMNNVGADLRNIDIMRRVSTTKDPGPTQTTFRVLYPADTEEEKQAQAYPPLYPNKEAYEAKVNQFETLLKSNKNDLFAMSDISAILSAIMKLAVEAFGAEEFKFFRFEKVKGASRTAPVISTKLFPAPAEPSIAKLINDYETTGVLKKSTASAAFNLAVAIAANNKQQAHVSEANGPSEPIETTSSINTDYTVVFNTINLYCKLSLLKAVIRFSKVVKEIETGFSELLNKLDSDTKGLLYSDSESVEAGPMYDEEADELVNIISTHLRDSLLGKEDMKSFDEYATKRQQLFTKRNKHKNIELPQGQLKDLSPEELFSA